MAGISLSAVSLEFMRNADPESRSRLLEDALSSIPEAVVLVRDHRVIYINPAFTRIFGYSEVEAIGADLRKLIVPERRQREDLLLEEMSEQNGQAFLEAVYQNKQGESLDLALAAAPLIVEGDKSGFILAFRDIRERKLLEAKLQHDAMHDLLTGLPNRALFLDRLSLALSRYSRRSDQSCGVFFLDLDRFKAINDTRGHAAGDALLVAVAERLRGALRPQDTASRLGGDEFALLVENIRTVCDLETVAKRVLHEMARPFEICGQSMQVGVSIGVAMAGPEHRAPELLIRDADFAMYRAKQVGGDRYEIFDKKLAVHMTSQIEREQELRHALDKREFELCYQPIFRLQNNKLEGFESQLCRHCDDGSFNGLDHLLPVAEETGLSVTLGRETIESVCRQLVRWSDGQPQADLALTVNLTPRQFYHPDLVPQLKRTLAKSGVATERILFEIAETTLNEEIEAASRILQRMAECNVRLAVDNFGSSLAPLNYLLRLPIGMVKLDAGMLAGAVSTARSSALLETMIHLGHTLGVQVVAQGVETAEQLETLRRMGCELGQGNFLSPILDPATAQKLAAIGKGNF
jgi:diguanylate cyclase (GGDEF)-like protein/PAS domain S-box-containing protein